MVYYAWRKKSAETVGCGTYDEEGLTVLVYAMKRESPRPHPNFNPIGDESSFDVLFSPRLDPTKRHS